MDNIANTQLTEAAGKKVNYIFFDPKEWTISPDVQDTTDFDELCERISKKLCKEVPQCIALVFEEI